MDVAERAVGGEELKKIDRAGHGFHGLPPSERSRRRGTILLSNYVNRTRLFTSDHRGSYLPGQCTRAIDHCEDGPPASP